IRRTQRRSLLNHRPHHVASQNVRLKLHQQLVPHHSAIHTQPLQLDSRVLLHRFHHFACLNPRRLHHRPCQIPLVCKTGQSTNHSARIFLPIRREQSRKRWHEIHSSVVLHRSRQRLDLCARSDHYQVVTQPLH